MTPQHRWPDGPDEISAELRRALDEASLRGPDDMTLRRGWSAVASPLEPPRARRGFWFAGGVATTAALVVVGAFWLWPRAVELAQSNGRDKVAKSELTAPGPRRLTLEGGVEAVLGRSSVMRIEDDAPRVEGGEVRFSVPHRQPGHPFVVRAEGYRVVVVGTRFGINVGGESDGKHAVGVDVDEGIVEVGRPGTQRRLARLTPGESWQSPGVAARSARRRRATVPAPPARRRRTTPPRRRSLRQAGTRTRASRPWRWPRRAKRRRRPSARAPSRRRRAKRPPPGPRSCRATPHARCSFTARWPQGTGPSAGERRLRGRQGPERKARAADQPWRPGAITGPPIPTGSCASRRTCRSSKRWPVSATATRRCRRQPTFCAVAPTANGAPEIARLAGDLYRARGDCRHARLGLPDRTGASRPRDVVEAAAFHRADCLVRLGDRAAPTPRAPTCAPTRAGSSTARRPR